MNSLLLIIDLQNSFINENTKHLQKSINELVRSRKYNYDVYVLKDYCACTHGQERNNNALNIIGRCIGRNKII